MKRLVFLLIALGLTARVAMAQDNKDDEDKEEKDEFAEIIEDATFHEGFLDAYEKDDHLYFVIPNERLGEEFLLFSNIATGLGSGGMTGGLMLDIFLGEKIVALEKHGEKVYLLERPFRYVADAGTPEAVIAILFNSFR